MDSQPDLFRSTPPPAPKTEAPSLLIPVPARAKTGLSRLQQTFNRLVRQVETLERDIERATGEWNHWLEYYATRLHPLESQIAKARKDVVRLLLLFLGKHQKLTPAQRRDLRAILRDQLQAILDADGEWSDDDLERAYHDLASSAPPDLRDVLFAAMRDELASFVQQAGLDVDLSDLHSRMSSADVYRKLGEIADQLEDATPPQPRKQNARQIAREQREREAEELRAKHLGTLYRQLAKLLHPDLEQDPARRQEKEAAMKELTTAYRANDLHALLRMEIQFISREQADAARLSDRKLSLYVSVLREQVASLKETLHSLGHHPRYSPLRRYLSPFEARPHFNGPATLQRLRVILLTLEASLARLRGPDARAEVVSVIQDYRRHG